MPMKIVLTADHAGFHLKQQIADWLNKKKVDVVDVGPIRKIPNDDYPLYARKAVEEVKAHTDTLGIFVCGSGVGMAIVANRFKGIRAAQAESVATARRAKKEDHANVLVLGSRIISFPLAQKIVSAFLTSRNSTAVRHRRRVRQIDSRA